MIGKSLLFIGLFLSNGIAVTWDQLILIYNEHLEEGSLLQRQYLSYISSNTPAIVDPRIKEIPILENNEPLIDVKEQNHERIQMLPDPSFPFEQPYFNSGMPSASKMRIGLYRKLEKMIDALDRLSPSFGYQHGQICIRIFEGLRDLNTQTELYQKKLKEILRLSPHLTLEEAEKETSKWVSPVKNNIPVHSTGAAVDIRLWDAFENDFLDMGTFGVIQGPNPTAPTFSENLTDEQKKNRIYCLIAAEQSGLTNYSFEFWHFSSKDRYAVFWENRNEPAFYGAID
jgi:hypothetical protein